LPNVPNIVGFGDESLNYIMALFSICCQNT